MKRRSIDEINDEINRVKSIVEPMEKYLLENPDDLSIEANTLSLNDRLNQLYFELDCVKNQQGLYTFDLYLSNVNGGKIKLNSFIKTICQFQKTLIVFSMYDGVHPVGEKSVPSKEIIDYSDFDVEIVETNSLKILLSVDEKKNKISFDSPVYTGFKNLIEIISCGDDKEKLNEFMGKIGVQPVLRYKKLLKILTDNELNLDIFRSIIPKGFVPQNLSIEFANKVYPVIDELN